MDRHSATDHHQALRVLHLFSNCKWTGPAEPALNLCVALRERGVDAQFACAPDAGASINKVVETARDRGVEPILRLYLNKHRHPWKNWYDRFALARLIREARYDLIHCHMDNDHEIASLVAQYYSIPLVRTSYHGSGLPLERRQRRLLTSTEFLIEPSVIAMEHDVAHFGFGHARVRVIPGAVDVHRFDAAREVPDGRRWLNLPPDAFVLGIVARMQTHRHYEDLFFAFKELLHHFPKARLVVVGRGTKQHEVAFRPVSDLGLENHVHFTGFIDGENYVGVLRAFDAGAFLVPGSDGTCRAAREIMAMGKPMVVADRGMLREIVHHGKDGLVCDGSVEGLYLAFRSLAEDASRRRAMGQAARLRAETAYSLEAQAAAVHEVYQTLLKR